MRINLRGILVILTSFSLVWLSIMVFHTVMERPNLAKLSLNEEDVMVLRVKDLEKRVYDQLEENKIILKQLRDDLRNHLERRKKASLQRFTQKVKDQEEIVLPVLVMACNRITVSRCLDSLTLYRPNKTIFPIIVSQDCNHPATREVINKYVNKNDNIFYIKQPDQSEIALPSKNKKFIGYYKISRHYKFALSHVFDNLGHKGVIIVEDDLDISPDFFEYFLGTYPLLQKDPTLWCVSAWNDNGKRSLIDTSSPELLYRTDFFPGLGWLLQSRHWDIFKHKWPPAFFDDWLRENNQTGGLSCIRPEIPRTITFGKVGVSKGMYFDNHLRHIVLNKQFVNFTKMDLSYLLKPNYDKLLQLSVDAATELSLGEVTGRARQDLTSVKIVYGDEKSFKKIAHTLGLMDDFRSGVARTIYNGVVTCFYKGRRVYIAPKTEFTGYNPSWS